MLEIAQIELHTFYRACTDPEACILCPYITIWRNKNLAFSSFYRASHKTTNNSSFFLSRAPLEPTIPGLRIREEHLPVTYTRSRAHTRARNLSTPSFFLD